MNLPQAQLARTMRSLDHYPVSSRAERDRRLGLARGLMAREGLDALILGQGGSRVFQYFAISQQCFSNEPDGQGALLLLLLIPRDGEPVLLLLRAQWGQVGAEQHDGAEPWIADYRRQEGDVNPVAVLKEKGLLRGTVGLVLSAALATPHAADDGHAGRRGRGVFCRTRCCAGWATLAHRLSRAGDR